MPLSSTSAITAFVNLEAGNKYTLWGSVLSNSFYQSVTGPFKRWEIFNGAFQLTKI